MLEAFVFAGAALVGVPGGIYLRVRQQRALRRGWSEAARGTPLEGVVEETSFWSAGILTARAGTHPVRIEEYARSRYDRGTRIIVRGDSGLSLRLESNVPLLQKALGPRETEIGDEEFDREVYVQGDPALLRAVLDAQTRRMVRDLLAGSLWAKEGGSAPFVATRGVIQDGDIALEASHRAGEVLRSCLPGFMDRLLAIAGRLERPASLVQRLVENTPREPEWRVRVETIRLLAREYPGLPATREAFERGFDDEHQEVQLQSALALGGAKGRAMLLNIASREWSDDAQSARAVDALDRALPLDRGQAILAHALRTRRHDTARACLDALGRSRDPAVVHTLAKVMRVQSGALAVTAARALGASRAAAAERPLLDALADEAADLRLAAVEALGRVGSPAAVSALKEAAERDANLRRAARQAIAEIQARAGSASPGQVSLAEGPTGAVSLADEGTEGRVSMARDGGFDRERRD